MYHDFDFTYFRLKPPNHIHSLHMTYFLMQKQRSEHPIEAPQYCNIRNHTLERKSYRSCNEEYTRKIQSTHHFTI